MAGGYVVQTAVGFSPLPVIMMVEAPAIAVPSSPPQVVDVVPPSAYRGRIAHRLPQMMQENGCQKNADFCDFGREKQSRVRIGRMRRLLLAVLYLAMTLVRLYADTHRARQQPHHGVRSLAGCLIWAIQACALDLPNLIAQQPPALHVAMQLSKRVGRDRLALGRAQAFKAFGSLLFSLGLNPRMPSRDNVAFMRLMVRLCSPTRHSRSRLGRLASSSSIVGIATILQ
jgi:hypothetical protein